MPGLVVFGRRWRIASDDFVFPVSLELIIRLIWWILTLVLFQSHRGHIGCPGGELLRVYFLCVLLFQAITILVLLVGIAISMTGTINRLGPRRAIPFVIYIRGALYVPEMVWVILGTYWISKYPQGCGNKVLISVLGTVITSWVILIFTLLGVWIAFDPLGRGRKGPAQADRVWEKCIRRLCCCLSGDDVEQAAFKDVAHILSDFFRDTDLVPSDIAAGLTLLRWAEKKDGGQERLPLDEAPLAEPENLQGQLEQAAHFMRFAAGAYGWPLYIYSHPICGICHLCPSCCCFGASVSEPIPGNTPACHKRAILQSTGLQEQDLVHVSYHNKVFEVPFYVALDHKSKSVVVAVRGTLSLQDVLTDLSTDHEDVEIDGVPEGGSAHRGIMRAAQYVQERLIRDEIFNIAFSRGSGYALTIVGHSLGAGTAALLAVLLRPTFPTLRCFAYSPPGGLLSERLSEHSRDFVLSVVLGDDIIPRLSIANLNDLKMRILQAVEHSNHPKYQIFLRGCCREFNCRGICCSCAEQTSDESDPAGQFEVHRSYGSIPSLNGEFVPAKGLTAPTGEDAHLPLFLPGKIIHILEKTQDRCYTDIEYHAEWAPLSRFSNIVISPRMVPTHVPDAVLRALCKITRVGDL
uniref:diacylglycerol lipase-beta-like n=1 Tax=Myxine glutinosa TaxID=7769 RepID=UPI00358FED08